VDAAAALPSLTGPLSPELVLVSPPEVARLARIHLPSPAARPMTIDAPPAVGQPGAVELAAVWTFCLAMTVGPVVFLLALQA
jgi:capsular polysaccharide biosynthesis protein